MSGVMVAVLAIVAVFAVLALIFLVIAPRITNAGQRKRGPSGGSYSNSRKRR